MTDIQLFVKAIKTSHIKKLICDIKLSGRLEKALAFRSPILGRSLVTKQKIISL